MLKQRDLLLKNTQTRHQVIKITKPPAPTAGCLSRPGSVGKFKKSQIHLILNRVHVSFLDIKCFLYRDSPSTWNKREKDVQRSSALQIHFAKTESFVSLFYDTASILLIYNSFTNLALLANIASINPDKIIYIRVDVLSMYLSIAISNCGDMWHDIYVAQNIANVKQHAQLIISSRNYVFYNKK